MVFHDGTVTINGTDNGLVNRERRNVAVLDRVFAFFLDHIILSPVVGFINLIFFQKEIYIWKESASTFVILPLILKLIFFYIIVFSFLQSLFIYFWQASPGQYFLKIKLQIDPKPGLIFLRIMMRQLGFWGAAGLLGIPWLSVMGHPQAKTFYDRLSEITVTTLKPNSSQFIFEKEKKYWRSVMATFSLFAVIILGLAFWLDTQNINNGKYAFTKAGGEQSFCAELRNVSLKNRLQTAIALNLVGQLSDKCLDQEADFVLWNSSNLDNKSLAYYAKSLTVAESEASSDSDADTENNYLQQACKENQFAPGCQIAKAYRNDTLRELYMALQDDVYHNTYDNNLLKSTLKYELSILFDKEDERIKNFKSLKDFDALVAVKKYLLTEMLDSKLDNKLDNKINVNGRRPAAENLDVEMEYGKKLIQEM